MAEIDNEKLAQKFKSVSNYEDYYLMYGEPMVMEAVGELDQNVTKIREYQKRIHDLNLDFDTVSLQNMVIELSSCIYYTTDKLEKLELLADVSKLQYKNSYNNAYITKQGNHDAGTKYSVQQLQAFSENEALEDNIINFIYNRATSVVSNKLDAARELLKATSKALSANIESMKSFGVSNKYS